MSQFSLDPVTKLTSKEMVYKTISEAIFNGNIKKDEFMTEQQLAEALNTSRTPVREALTALVNEGLLVNIPRKGVVVREISESEKEQIMFLRDVIETEGVRVLSGNITNDQVQFLEELLVKQKKACYEKNNILFIEFDQSFHQNILNFSKLNLFEEIFHNLYNLKRLLGHKAILKEGRMEEVIEEHEGILLALKEKDPIKGIALVKQHLEHTKDTLNILKNGEEG
jgi:DNA-binding GntR family transcriptional regulator